MATRENVTEDWRIKGLHDLYSLQNIIQVITLSTIRWTAHVAPMVQKSKCLQGFGRET